MITTRDVARAIDIWTTDSTIPNFLGQMKIICRYVLRKFENKLRKRYITDHKKI